jgi:hypothetical protein
MRLKVAPTKGKNATEVCFSLRGGGGAVVVGFNSSENLSFAVTVVPEGFISGSDKINNIRARKK